jgi:hypothetical protein
LCVLLYKISEVQVVEEGDYKRMCFCKQFVQAVHDGGLGPKFPFVTDEACFICVDTSVLRTVSTGAVLI